MGAHTARQGVALRALPLCHEPHVLARAQPQAIGLPRKRSRQPAVLARAQPQAMVLLREHVHPPQAHAHACPVLHLGHQTRG